LKDRIPIQAVESKALKTYTADSLVSIF